MLSGRKLCYDLCNTIPALHFIISFNFKVDNLEDEILVWSYFEDLQIT